MVHPYLIYGGKCPVVASYVHIFISCIAESGLNWPPRFAPVVGFVGLYFDAVETIRCHSFNKVASCMLLYNDIIKLLARLSCLVFI